MPPETPDRFEELVADALDELPTWVLERQTGIAPNGIELHPVLNLTGDCHKASTGGGGGGGSACDASYPTICIPPPPPDLDCSDIPYRNFTVVPPDDHHLDGDGDGIGCQT